MTDSDRSAVVVIGGHTYEMILTTLATKAIGKRYGGLDKLGDKLMNTDNFELALDEIVWLVTLLANQGAMIHNFQHPDDQRALLTEDVVELMTTPTDLVLCKDAIIEAMVRGTKRFVESEPEKGKNAEAGQTMENPLPG